MELQIDLAFFSGDDLLARGEVRCGASEAVSKLEGASGHRFEVTSQFEEPACPVEIHCYRQEKRIYKAALRVGVHTSEDWEAIDLAGIHTLGFRCKELAEQAGMRGSGAALRSRWRIFRSISSLVRRRFAKLPVKPRVIVAALAPIYGNSGARLYLSGVRFGYSQEGYWMSGKHPCYSMGLRDGSDLRRDSSCWPRILQFHLDRATGIAEQVVPPNRSEAPSLNSKSSARGSED